MSGLETAASVLGIVDLARQTASFLRRVYRAQDDASELCERTKNLSRLVQDVNHLLDKRKTHRDDGASDSEAEIDKTMASSLKLCRVNLENLHSCFRPLVERDTKMTQAQVRDRWKFVQKKEYISAQENNISVHLSVLSVALNVAMHHENDEQRRANEAERQRREEAQRNQQEMHQAFLQQLFGLFQYLFRYAEAATAAAAAAGGMPSTTASTQAGDLSTDPLTVTRPVSINMQPRLLIENEETLQTIQNLFGNTDNQANPAQGLQAFVFNGSSTNDNIVDDEATIDRNIEEIECADDEMTELDRERSRTAQDARDVTLLLAVRRGQIDLIGNLVADGSNITTIDPYGWTLLHHAVFRYDEDIVGFLLKQDLCRNPDILDKKTRTGETALIVAVQKLGIQRDEKLKEKMFQIITRLLKAGCDVDTEDADVGGRSALYYAIYEGRPSNPRRRKLVALVADKASCATVRTVKALIPEYASMYDEFLSSSCSSCSDSDSRRSSDTSLRAPKPNVLRRMSELFRRRMSSSASTSEERHQSLSRTTTTNI